ncbi:MAG TPA: peptidoglycan-binding protein [Thermoanaerobaculia bacterium]|nr:peptidoglycan-binding protein [Thermoanaerobaculia bacterium]
MTRHRVRQGECISSIAHAYGFFWEALWEHPENRALAEARKDPNCLAPGDEVFIPDRRPKSVRVPTGACHRFRLRTTPVKLRLELLNDGEPIANKPFRLEVDGVVREGTTDDLGRVECWVAPGAQQGRLVVDEEEYDVLLRHLDPVGIPAGIQQRLANLGLYDGPIEGELGDAVRAALAELQLAEGLAATGEPDSATLELLELRHASEGSEPKGPE